MIRSFDGKTPKIAPSAFISELAYIVGDVEIGENSSVWPGAVIRADFAPIKIGHNTHVEDNCVIHAGHLTEPQTPLVIGNNVQVGHGAVVHARKIGDRVLIGMNATILQDVQIGDGCIIGAGAMVSQGMKIPDNSFVAGIPAKIVGRSSIEQQLWIEKGPEVYTKLAQKYKNQGL